VQRKGSSVTWLLSAAQSHVVVLWP
jgi:hypothetical protein